MIIGSGLALLLFDLDLSNFTESINNINPGNIPLLKFLQAFYSFGLFVFPPIMIAFFLNGRISEYLKINKLPLLLSLISVCLIMFFALPLINFMMLLNEQIHFPDFLSGLELKLKSMESEAMNLSNSFLKADSLPIYLVNLLVMAVIPAVGEEFLFRGIFQRLLTEWTGKIHLAIWISALLFSMMHMQFYGFIPRMVLGAFFGYLLWWSGNLWLPVIAHFINNSIAVTAFYLKNDITQKIDHLGAEKAISIELILSGLIVSILIYIIARVEKENNQKLKWVDKTDSENN
jgi:uncharacterized protein